jgi:hypothetical protein
VPPLLHSSARRRHCVIQRAAPPLPCSPEKPALPQWPSFIASPKLHHPVSESESEFKGRKTTARILKKIGIQSK